MVAYACHQQSHDVVLTLVGMFHELREQLLSISFVERNLCYCEHEIMLSDYVRNLHNLVHLLQLHMLRTNCLAVYNAIGRQSNKCYLHSNRTVVRHSNSRTTLSELRVSFASSRNLRAFVNNRLQKVGNRCFM